MALNTAIAWLGCIGKDGEDAESKARDAACKAYEGGYNHGGEAAGSASLARQYPTFDDLVADGDFYEWSRDLYQSLLDHPPAELMEEARA
ncbi:hypothetical protein ACE0DR_16370 [Azotobacter sp. CWF10]